MRAHVGPGHIPSGVRHFTARQLGIRDITVLAEYGVNITCRFLQYNNRTDESDSSRARQSLLIRGVKRGKSVYCKQNQLKASV